MINKFISNTGTILAVDDFYGSGTDEVIKSFERSGEKLTVNTDQGFYTLGLRPGDYLGSDDGTSEIIKTKYDKQDE